MKSIKLNTLHLCYCWLLTHLIPDLQHSVFDFHLHLSAEALTLNGCGVGSKQDIVTNVIYISKDVIQSEILPIFTCFPCFAIYQNPVTLFHPWIQHSILITSNIIIFCCRVVIYCLATSKLQSTTRFVCFFHSILPILFYEHALVNPLNQVFASIQFK